MTPFSKMFIEIAAKGDAARDAGLTEPADVEIRRDIPYQGDGSDRYTLLDVYWPKGSRGALPVIVNIHGGGYVYGDKEVYRFYCMSLAQQGFAVVNFSYHLAPMYRFPTQLGEIDLVLRWMTAQADRYPFDLGNVFFVGDSAGAQLASHYAALYCDRAFAALYPFAPADGYTLRAVALNCGMYDLAAAALAPPPAQPAAVDHTAIYEDYMGPDRQKLRPMLEVLDAIGPNYPPAFVMTSWYDFLQAEAEPMVRLLQARGVEAEYHLYGQEGQEYMGHVFHCNIRLPEAAACNRAECDFFRRHIVPAGH